ncbi:DUF262 domain-containing protein [Dyella sp.]|uniref:DUF262 domain-containing protein n=1 Tax=Dyella sp. TaxID=1869338 RepID=UPI003F7E84A4
MNYDVSLQTIAWFNEKRNAGRLQLSPEYQRRAVWTDKERSHLVSTVCEQLPFPEVYVQVSTVPATGEQSLVVVDGQQRITSLLMFIDGQVSLPDVPHWRGARLADLPEPVQRAFWEYKIVVRQLSNVSDAEIREIFERLNINSFSLNDQELRNARYKGSFIGLAERLADNPFFSAIGLFTPRQIRRMLDVEFISELLLLQIEGVTNKKDMLEDAYAQFEEELPDESNLELEFNAAMTLLQSIFAKQYSGHFKTKSNFYTLFGAALSHYRVAGSAAFLKPVDVSNAVGQFLIRVRDEGVASGDPIVAEYADAVSRAASDRARRLRREQIMIDIVEAANA